MSKEKLTYRHKHSPLECAAILHQIADALQNGRVELSHTEDSLVLEPSQFVELRLKGKADGDGQKVELDLKWSKPNKSFLKIEASPSKERVVSTTAETAQVAVVEVEETAFHAEETARVEESAPAEEAIEAAPVVVAEPTATVRACEAWVSREQLYEIAQEVELEGRSSMSKEDLCRALVSAGVDPLERMTKTALYTAAQQAEIDGRSQLNRRELAHALKVSASSSEERLRD